MKTTERDYQGAQNMKNARHLLAFGASDNGRDGYDIALTVKECGRGYTTDVCTVARDLPTMVAVNAWLSDHCDLQCITEDVETAVPAILAAV